MLWFTNPHKLVDTYFFLTVLFSFFFSFFPGIGVDSTFLEQHRLHFKHKHILYHCKNMSISVQQKSILVSQFVTGACCKKRMKSHRDVAISNINFCISIKFIRGWNLIPLQNKKRGCNSSDPARSNSSTLPTGWPLTWEVRSNKKQTVTLVTVWGFSQNKGTYSSSKRRC